MTPPPDPWPAAGLGSMQLGQADIDSAVGCEADYSIWLARMEADPIGELCRLVKECGGTMRLYGKPVEADELRAFALVSALDRLADRTSEAKKLDHARRIATSLRRKVEVP